LRWGGGGGQTISASSNHTKARENRKLSGKIFFSGKRTNRSEYERLHLHVAVKSNHKALRGTQATFERKFVFNLPPKCRQPIDGGVSGYVQEKPGIQG
jgi:hypothetical protein